MNLPTILLTALLSLGFAALSHADVAFSNLGETRNGAAGFNSLDDRLASDFITDGTPWTITSLTASMGNSSIEFTHTVTFSIFMDDNGSPGTLLSAFATPASITPEGATGTATSPGISLQPNTPYWVVGQVNEGLFGTVTWDFNNGEGSSGPFSTVSGTEMMSSGNGGLIYFPSGSGNYKFALEGTTTVPEPQTWLALLVTLGTFVVFRRWRQNRATLDCVADRGLAS